MKSGARSRARHDKPTGFKPCEVVELAVGIDRLVALANGGP